VDVAASYRTCARITRRQARTFYVAFLTLPRAQRLAVYALYTFCRFADDVADAEGTNGDAEARRAGLARLRERLARAAEGLPEDGPDVALADAIERFGVDPRDLGAVLDGVEMDLDLRRVETLDELRDYAYLVASAVGLATLPILNAGVPPTDAMREAAVDLGLGMQLVNILRDVAEDLDRGRVYLPRDEMAAVGVDEAMLERRAMTAELRGLLAAHADRAEEHLEHGRRLVALLPRRGGRCPWLLGELYRRILRRIRTREYDVFGERVALSTREKLSLLVSSLRR
jgi:phytoene synthase